MDAWIQKILSGGHDVCFFKVIKLFQRAVQTTLEKQLDPLGMGSIAS